MFHHTVLIGFTGIDAQFLNAIGEYVVQIRAMGDGLLAFQMVENTSPRRGAFSHAFIATFKDLAAHDRFQISPLHEALKQFITPHVAALTVLDNHDESLF